MSLLTTNFDGVLSPEEVSELVVQLLTQRSVCLQTTNVVPTTTSCGCRSLQRTSTQAGPQRPKKST